MPDPIYFHCDCNAFFASVEETFRPEYKKLPMAVAGDPANRQAVREIRQGSCSFLFANGSRERLAITLTFCYNANIKQTVKKTKGEIT